VVDGGEPGVDSRDEGKHTGRNDLLFVEKMMWMGMWIAHMLLPKTRKRRNFDSKTPEGHVAGVATSVISDAHDMDVVFFLRKLHAFVLWRSLTLSSCRVIQLCVCVCVCGRHSSLRILWNFIGLITTADGRCYCCWRRYCCC